MTDPVGPAAAGMGVPDATVRGSADGPERRTTDRRRTPRRKADAPEPGTEIVPAGPRADHAPEAPATPAAAFAAQLIGQEGQKRGLKGGPPVLGAARSTYLGAEYSGENDRRPATGRTRKTEI